MTLEIERKFLVANDGWKTAVVRSVRIRDGLIANNKGNKARGRIANNVATIALKSDGVVVAEIELADAGQQFALPDWIGAEVTSDPRYRTINMIADRVANQKSAATALLARTDEVIE